MCYNLFTMFVHKKRKRYSILFKAITSAIACLFLVNSIPFIPEAHALAPSAGTRNPFTRCEYEILTLLHSGRLMFDNEKADAKELLDRNKADVLLLSHGKILARADLKKDPPKLFRKIIHEQIETIMQIMAREDRAKYSMLINMILGTRVSWPKKDKEWEYERKAIQDIYFELFPNVNLQSLDNELLANHIIATAFELRVPLLYNLMNTSDMSNAEERFLSVINPIIDSNKHSYFTGVFWDNSVREAKIRVAMANGMKFTQVASSRNEALLLNTMIGASIIYWYRSLIRRNVDGSYPVNTMLRLVSYLKEAGLEDIASAIVGFTYDQLHSGAYNTRFLRRHLLELAIGLNNLGYPREKSRAILAEAEALQAGANMGDSEILQLAKAHAIFGEEASMLNYVKQLIAFAEQNESKRRPGVDFDSDTDGVIDHVVRILGRAGKVDEIAKLELNVRRENRKPSMWGEEAKALAERGDVAQAIRIVKERQWPETTGHRADTEISIIRILIEHQGIECIFKDDIAELLTSVGAYSSERAYRDAVKFYLKQGALDRAQEIARLIHEEHEIRIEVLADIASAYARKGMISEAESLCAEARALLPKLSENTPGWTSDSWRWRAQAFAELLLERPVIIIGKDPGAIDRVSKKRSDFIAKERKPDFIKTDCQDLILESTIILMEAGAITDLVQATYGLNHNTLNYGGMQRIIDTFIHLIGSDKVDTGIIRGAVPYIASGMPVRQEFIEEYFESKDKAAYIANLKARAERVLDDGFDSKDENANALVTTGLAAKGIYVDDDTYKKMHNGLMEYASEHPEYFKNLFDKKGYPAFRISEKEGIVEDTSQVDIGKVQSHIETINKMSVDLANLAGIDNTLISKAYAYCKLKKKLEEDETLRSHIGSIKMSDVNAHLKWHCPDFSIDKARGYLIGLDDMSFLAEAVYFVTFNMYLSKREDRLLNIMLSCTIADALANGALNALINRSGDVTVQLKAIAQIYTDSKFHIPDKLGLLLHKRLAQKIGAFSDEIFKEISKVTAKRVVHDTEKLYDFVPSKFLGVFRGNIVGDCTCDEDKGKAYTRAMHEDTMYYMVYANGELTGYIGLMEAECADSKVLTIDTMQPVPPKLVPDILRKLHDIAILKGCIGIALPSDKDRIKVRMREGEQPREALWASFNYPEVRAAIQMLPGYQKGRRIKAKPIHNVSWEAFQEKYGVHPYDSIVTGAFVLVAPDYVPQRKSSSGVVIPAEAPATHPTSVRLATDDTISLAGGIRQPGNVIQGVTPSIASEEAVAPIAAFEQIQPDKINSVITVKLGISLPDGLSKDWYDWLNSLKALGETAAAEFAQATPKLEKNLIEYNKTGQSLILYADDILENALVVDLENTAKNILVKHNILNGGRIILYSKNEASAAILEKVIKHAGPNLETVKIAQSDLQTNGDEIKEIDALLRVARAKGTKELLGLIKGPTNKPEELAAFAKDASLPIVIVGPEKGVYSFAQAIAIAIDAKITNGATSGWLIMLPPIRVLTDDIRRQYEEYQHSLQALVAA